MARKRGLFSTGTAQGGAGLFNGVFNGINAAENINNSRAARAAEAERSQLERVKAIADVERGAKGSYSLGYDAAGRPVTTFAPGTQPEVLSVLRQNLGLTGIPGAEAGLPSSVQNLGAAGTVHQSPPQRPPAGAPETAAQKAARTLLEQTFTAQNKFQDVDEQTADSAVQAGRLIGVPVTKETIQSKVPLIGKYFQPKFRISMGGAAPAPAASSAAPRPAPAAKIRVSNGKETLLIDPQDEQSAAADGYTRI